MATELAVSLRDISKKYKLFSTPRERLKEAFHPFRKRYHREFWALSGISFEVARGETLGIIGPNGSGKSTLLQIIVGVLKSASGNLKVNGRVAALLELGAGFNPEFTGRDNVIFNAVLQGMSSREIQRRLPDIEAFADIGEFFDQPVRTYSSGMYVRVAFAAAINVDPDILIIDEALAVGDIRFQAKCFEKFRSLQAKGKTILFVTHATDIVTRLCHRTILLDKGVLVFDGHPRHAVNMYDQLMFGTSPSDQSTKQVQTETTLPKTTEGQVYNPLQSFLNDTQLSEQFHLRRAYNPEHTCLGDGRAKLLDFLILSDGEPDPVDLRQSTHVELYAKYRFLEEITNPSFGFGIRTLDGTKVFGTNTNLLSRPIGTIRKGSIVIWKSSFYLRLLQGEYVLHFGVADDTADGPKFADARRGIVCFRIRDHSAFTGLADLQGSIETVRRADPD